MKKNLIYLCLTILMVSIVMSCNDDDGDGKPKVEASPIKTITLDYTGDGSEKETWEFFYDATGRVESIDVYWNGVFDKEIIYDYSVAGKLTINNNGNLTVYVLDAAGRAIKELWNDAGTEWEGYEYDDTGLMKKIVEHWDGIDHLKYNLTIENKNIVNRIRYEDDGTTVIEDREFIYTSGDNFNNIHQIYAVDSEWKHVGGLFGIQSKKLVDKFVRHITAEPGTSYGADFDYTFDTKNRPATITKNGTSSGGAYTEILTYTYYEK